MSDDVIGRVEEYIADLRHNSERRSDASFDTGTADQIADELEELLQPDNAKRRELAGKNSQEVIERRMDYIIQAFSNIHARWGWTRRRGTLHLDEMEDDAELLKEAARELQIAIDLYREEVGPQDTETEGSQ